MSTEPYVPTLSDAQSVYVLGRATTRRRLAGEQAVDVTPYSAEFDRFVAKIKADALRVAAIGITTQVENAEAREAELNRVPGPYYHGASYGMRKTAQWLHRRADRIEEEA